VSTPSLTIPVLAAKPTHYPSYHRRFQLYASGKTEVWAPVQAIVFFYPSDSLQAFMQLYSEILDAGGPAFGAILRHVRDSPNDAFIFHCTGQLRSLFCSARPPPHADAEMPYSREGQDWDRRCSASSCASLASPCPFIGSSQSLKQIPTQLAGASTDAISADYALTRIGRAPMRPLILSRLAREPLFASDPTAAHNMLSSRCVRP
jgi:hypothetical protein